MPDFMDVKVGDTVLAMEKWHPEKPLLPLVVTKLTPAFIRTDKGYTFYKSNGSGRGMPYDFRLMKSAEEQAHVLFMKKYERLLWQVDSDELRQEIINLIELKRKP